MSNDKAFKIKKGISVGTTYQQSSGTVTTTAAGLDVKTAKLEGLFYASQPGTTGADIFFKPDGTKLYMQDSTTVYQYSLSTAWDITTASYDSKSLVVESTGNLNGFFIGDSGTKLYGLNDGNYNVRQYNLSTAWDVSTGSFDDTGDAGSGLPSGVYSGARTVNFSSDGTKLYVHFDGPDGSVYQYTLSTAWDINTLSYSKRSIPILSLDDVLARSYDGLTYGIRFSTDGTEMFMLGKNTSAIFKFGLTTAWDIGTLYYTGQSTPDYFHRMLHNEAVVVENNTSGLALNTEDGSTIYMRGQQRGTVMQFTGAGETKTLDLSSGNYFKLDLSKGTNIAFSNPPPSGVAYAATIEIETTAGYDIQSSYEAEKLSTQQFDGESNADGVAFKPDGTKMYITGATTDKVHQYALSTPWDVTSAVLETELLVSDSGANPEDIFFKPDGTKMYIVNSGSDSVYEYKLSMPWNIEVLAATATSFSVSAQETTPRGLTFKPDGTRMYVVGIAGDDMNEYSLSTAWDVTTASISSTTSFPTFGNTANFSAQGPEAIAFTPDGTRLFVCSNGPRQVISHPLSTAWDTTTMQAPDRFFHTGVNVGFGPSSTRICSGIAFKPDGSKYFITSNDVQLGLYTTAPSFSKCVIGVNMAAPFKVSWPTSVKWDQNERPDPPDQGKKWFYTILTVDGGSTYYGKVSGGHVG